MKFAQLQLGGLTVGKGDSVFTTFANYSGWVIGEDYVPYGPRDTNLISYTFDGGNGFSAIASLEGGGKSFGTDYAIDSYTPHLVGGIKYANERGSIVFLGGYDAVNEEFAIKSRLDLNVSKSLSLYLMAGWGSEAGDPSLGNYYKPWRGEWAVWAGASYRPTSDITLNLQGSYSDKGTGGVFGTTSVGDNQWALVANVFYQMVDKLYVVPEINYFNIDKKSGAAFILGVRRDF